MLGLLGLKLLRVRIRQLRATATKKSWTSSTLYVQATISSTIDLNPIAFGISSSRLLSWLITLNWGLTQCPTSQQCDHVFGGNTPLAPVGGPICSKMVLGGGDGCKVYFIMMCLKSGFGFPMWFMVLWISTELMANLSIGEWFLDGLTICMKINNLQDPCMVFISKEELLRIHTNYIWLDITPFSEVTSVH